ncbi:MAG: hypothetical protein JWM52_798 [Candidatus Saccharibacteria bacterium]|nr:hypothetical protein [Candidatus Saccharibacteria bacterium]
MIYPPLIEVVSRDRAAMAALRNARIFHTVGLTLWSREELIAVAGVTLTQVRHMEATLKQAGLALRPYSYKKVDMVIDQLPVDETSSAELLHLWFTNREEDLKRKDSVRYYPCAVVTLLSANLGCQTVGDLLGVNIGEIRRLLRALTDNQWQFYVGHNPHARRDAQREVIIPKMVGNYFDRLGRWDLSQKVQVLTRPAPHSAR